MMNFSQIALSFLNSGWFSVILFIMFAQLVLVYIPVLSHYFDIWDTDKGRLIFRISMGIMALCAFIIASAILASIPASLHDSEQKLVDSGKYYTEQCVLIEGNIDNGFFSDKTNKLQCGKTLKNITVNDYNRAIDAYKKTTGQAKDVAHESKAISLNNFDGTETQYLMLLDPETKCKYQTEATKDKGNIEKWSFVIINSNCNGIVQSGDNLKYKMALPDNRTVSFIEPGSTFTLY